MASFYNASVAMLCLLSFASQAQMAGDQDCGNPYDSPGRYGPYDYTDGNRHAELALVENAHFTAYMQDLAVNGFTSLKPRVKEEFGNDDQVVGDNFDYTLHAFPNHHRALYTMAMWQLRMAKKPATNLRSLMTALDFMPAECYFRRAMMFKPGDGMVREAFGAFLHKAGDLNRAEEQYLGALELSPNSAELHYNLGLLYVDMGKYDAAAEHGARAKELGYPLQGLQRKLDRSRSAQR